METGDAVETLTFKVNVKKKKKKSQNAVPSPGHRQLPSIPSDCRNLGPATVEALGDGPPLAEVALLPVDSM